MLWFLVHVLDGIVICSFEFYNVRTGDLETEFGMKDHHNGDEILKSDL